MTGAPLRAAMAGALAAAALVIVAAAMPASAQRPERYASGIPNPSNLAFDRRGRLWATSAGHQAQASDGVWLVRRRGARPRQVVRGLFSALGLSWHRGRLYVSHIVPARTFAPRHTGRVTAFWRFDGARFRRSQVVVDGLPAGRHRPDSIVPGPRRRLYLGVGSQFDNRRSARRLAGTVVSFRPDGRGLRVEAAGLRNPYGLAFLPGTSLLLIAEHGRDDLGLDRPPEEINLVDVDRRAADFGFPDCYGQRGPACRRTRRPLARLAPHAAPGAVAVSGRTAYVTEFGSSFAARPSGGRVVAVRLTRRAGRWRAMTRRFGPHLGLQNPLGAAIGPDGALYVSLWRRGRVVRFVLPGRARQAVAPDDSVARLIRTAIALLGAG